MWLFDAIPGGFRNFAQRFWAIEQFHHRRTHEQTRKRDNQPAGRGCLGGPARVCAGLLRALGAGSRRG